MPINSQATQTFVPIKEIREGVVILKDESFRMVMMASTLNFALKSEDEQTSIVLQYQNFLNSLDFPVQIFIQSRKININPYLATLEEARKEQINDLLKIQTKEYEDFIRNFVASTNIVEKNFYVVTPYEAVISLPSNSSGGFIGKALSIFHGQRNDQSQAEAMRFAEARLQIQQRTDFVAQGLASAGIRSKILGTEELIELYYKLFNPGELEKDSLKNLG